MVARMAASLFGSANDLATAVIMKRVYAEQMFCLWKTDEVRSTAARKHVGTTVGIAISGTQAVHGEAFLAGCCKLTPGEFMSAAWLARRRCAGAST